MAQKVQAKVS